jgi:hypothetical protein
VKKNEVCFVVFIEVGLFECEPAMFNMIQRFLGLVRCGLAVVLSFLNYFYEGQC